jgi:hypothetical protein
MLTNHQIEFLAEKMNVPLAYCGFKDRLPQQLQTNKAYIINLDDSVCKDTGAPSQGTHWTGLYCAEYPSGKREAMWFDSYGAPPPEIVKQRVRHSFRLGLPYNTKDIQSLMNQACGWYVLAWLHYVCAYGGRTRRLYQDTEDFLGMFQDLNVSVDWKQNEYILKLFFQPADPAERKEIEVLGDPHSITDGCEQELFRDLPDGAESGELVRMDVATKFI